jgi:hypothetical protein
MNLIYDFLEEHECCHNHDEEIQMPDQYDCWCTLQKMNLQEAFQLYKYDLISRSRQRQREIKIREARRKVEADIKVKAFMTVRNNIQRSVNNNQKQTGFHQRSHQIMSRQNRNADNKINYFVIDRDVRPARSLMTTQQIKEQTKKKYQNLPEVRQKQIKKKLEAEKQKNRIKSEIYKKVRLFFFIISSK